ncbi:MAG: hypothetical protein ABJB76_06395 [Candidatus Nitrosocosmicus sp.]
MSNEDYESLDYEIETNLEYLTQFFSIDEDKIQKVIDLFNTQGANTSYEKIAELTGFELGSDAINIKDALINFIHFYRINEKFVEDNLDNSKKSNKAIIEKLHSFVKKLNEKALKGLDLLYAITVNDERPTLIGIEDKLLLTEVSSDDNGNQLGYLPSIRLTLNLLDEDGDEMSQTFFMPLDNFNVFVESLKRIQTKAKESTKRYQSKLGESVILGYSD